LQIITELSAYGQCFVGLFELLPDWQALGTFDFTHTTLGTGRSVLIFCPRELPNIGVGILGKIGDLIHPMVIHHGKNFRDIDTLGTGHAVFAAGAVQAHQPFILFEHSRNVLQLLFA
jgi:hypothetical protein